MQLMRRLDQWNEYVRMYVFFLLHAPLLGIILHALLWYLQIQCLEISTLIISYYEISLIYLVR